MARPPRVYTTQEQVYDALQEHRAACFWFVRWLIPGQEPQGSQAFSRLRLARSYARRAIYSHPSWGYQIVHHKDGEQTVVDEVRS